MDQNQYFFIQLRYFINLYVHSWPGGVYVMFKLMQVSMPRLAFLFCFVSQEELRVQLWINGYVPTIAIVI